MSRTLISMDALLTAREGEKITPSKTDKQTADYQDLNTMLERQTLDDLDAVNSERTREGSVTRSNNVVWGTSHIGLDWDRDTETSANTADEGGLSSMLPGIGGEGQVNLKNDNNGSQFQWGSAVNDSGSVVVDAGWGSMGKSESFNFLSTGREYCGVSELWGGWGSLINTNCSDDATGATDRQTDSCDLFKSSPVADDFNKGDMNSPHKSKNSTPDPIGPASGHRRSCSVTESTTSGGEDVGNEHDLLLTARSMPEGQQLMKQLGQQQQLQKDEKTDERSQPDGAEVSLQNKDEMIEKMINSNDGWGRRQVRQDVPWQIQEPKEEPMPHTTEPTINAGSVAPAAAMATIMETLGMVTGQPHAPKLDGMSWNQPRETSELYWNGGPGVIGSADYNNDGVIGTWGSSSSAAKPVNQNSWLGGSSNDPLNSMGIGAGDRSFLNLQQPAVGGGDPAVFNLLLNNAAGGKDAQDSGRFTGFSNQFSAPPPWNQPPPSLGPGLPGIGGVANSDATLSMWKGSSSGEDVQSFMSGGKIGQWGTPGQSEKPTIGTWGQPPPQNVPKREDAMNMLKFPDDKFLGMAADLMGRNVGAGGLPMTSEQPKGRMLRGKKDLTSPDSSSFNFAVPPAAGPPPNAFPNFSAGGNYGQQPGAQQPLFPFPSSSTAGIGGMPSRGLGGFDNRSSGSFGAQQPGAQISPSILLLQSELQPLLYRRSQVQQNALMSPLQKRTELEQLNLRITAIKRQIDQCQDVSANRPNPGLPVPPTGMGNLRSNIGGPGKVGMLGVDSFGSGSLDGGKLNPDLRRALADLQLTSREENVLAMQLAAQIKAGNMFPGNSGSGPPNQEWNRGSAAFPPTTSFGYPPPSMSTPDASRFGSGDGAFDTWAKSNLGGGMLSSGSAGGPAKFPWPAVSSSSASLPGGMGFGALSQANNWGAGPGISESQLAGVGSGLDGQGLTNWLLLKNIPPHVDGGVVQTLCEQNVTPQVILFNKLQCQALVCYSSRNDVMTAERGINVIRQMNSSISLSTEMTSLEFVLHIIEGPQALQHWTVLPSATGV